MFSKTKSKTLKVFVLLIGLGVGPEYVPYDVSSSEIYSDGTSVVPKDIPKDSQLFETDSDSFSTELFCSDQFL